MKGLFIPGITENMFRNGCLESIEALMAEGEMYDLDYSDWTLASERLPEQAGEYLVTYHDNYAKRKSLNKVIDKYINF